MKLNIAIQLLSASLPVILAGRSGLRRQTTSTTPSTTDEIPNTPGYSFSYPLSQKEFDYYPGAGHIRTIDPSQISNCTMSAAYLDLYPGGIRELHWHPFSTEWGFITEGKCRFTLIDNDGNYENGYAETGDIWNFPTSFGHSIQAVDPDVGCKMVLFFSAPYIPTVNDISVSQMMTAFPIDVLEENLGAPASVIETFYQTGMNLSPGPMPPPPFPKSTSPLKEDPIFPATNGTCLNTGDGGYLLQVRNDIFPGITEMSGGYMHLEEGALRDIHWHPNANEMDYILNGKLEIGIYSIDDVFETVTLEAGDVGFVPQGMAHYLKAVDGPVDLLVAFDSPYWTTQELSTFLAVTPSYITAATLNTTTGVVDEYFPKETDQFFGTTSEGCPAVLTVLRP